MVRGDAEKTSGLQTRSEQLEHDAVQESPLPLLPLGPWVWKVNVEGAHRRGQKSFDEKAAVRTQDPRVTQRRSCNPIAADPVIGERALQAEKVVLRIRPRGRDQEARLPAPDLDLERRTPRKQRGGIDPSAGPELLIR